MAKVKMDISEYEALKELKEQLKDSLDTERVLRQELSDAQEREVEALKKNEKIVTIVTENVSEETVLVKNSPKEIIQNLEYTLKNLKDSRHRGYMSYPETDYFCSKLTDLFFTKNTVRMTPQTTVTTKGFDEVSEEVRAKTEQEVKELNSIRMEAIERELKEAKAKADRFEENASKYSLVLDSKTQLEKELEEAKSNLKEARELRNIYEKLFIRLPQILRKYTGIMRNRNVVADVTSLMSEVKSEYDIREKAKEYDNR